MDTNVTAIDRLWVKSKLFELDYLPPIAKSVRNWPDLVLFNLGLKKSVTVYFNDKTLCYINNQKDFEKFRNDSKTHINVFNALSKDANLSFDKSKIQFNFKGKKLTFYYNKSSFAPFSVLREVFIDNKYSRLKVAEKDVVDIGSFIGDTPIYFALKGARKVYAFDTSKKFCELAKKNARVNGLTKKISVFARQLSYDTLTDFIMERKIRNGVLKIDCEGCEYPLLLGRHNRFLTAFNQIELEYHRGYINIEKKLREEGFKVSHTIPKSFDGHYFGHILATRDDVYE